MNRTSDYQPLYGDQQYWQIADDSQSQPQGSHHTDESLQVFADDYDQPGVFQNVDNHSQQVRDDDQNKSRSSDLDTEVAQQTSAESQSQPRGSHDAVKNPKPEPTAQQQPSRLGWLAKLSIITSLLTLSIAVGFLSWLWWTPREDAAWRAWVLIPNRLQLSITLASVCIRTAVGILASISTAMLASVAVETRGIYLSDVAQVSITRFASSGPLSLVPVGLRGSLAEKRLRFLLMLLVITTFAAQFSSTILISDLEVRQTVSFPKEIPNVFGFGSHRGAPEAFKTIDHQDPGRNGFRQRPRLYPIFAEYSLPSIGASGVDDTGLSVRAFLPFSSQETRESISEFTGMAHVFDSRVICLAPKVDSLDLDQSDNDESVTGIRGYASFDRDILEKAGINITFSLVTPFSCSFITRMTGAPNQTVWAICRLEGLLGFFAQPSFIPYNDVASTLRLLWDGANYRWRPDLPNMRYSRKYGGRILDFTTTTSGPWLNVVVRGLALNYSNQETIIWELRFRMSACFTPLLLSSTEESGYFNISAVSLVSNTEPTYQWETESQSYNASSVRRQLGVVPTVTSSKDRQVMSLSPDITQIVGASLTNKTVVPFLELERWPDEQDIAFCFSCAALGWNDISVDAVYAELFKQTMENTGSPAQALQAVRFTRARDGYYALMDAFVPVGTASVTYFEKTPMPVRGRGYWSVLGILGVFVATFGIVGLRFRSTHNSLPENAWHTIAQLSESSEISQVLGQSKLASDKAVEHLIDGTRHPVGFAGHVGNFSAAMRRFWNEVAAAITFRPRNDKPRFVVRDGVFVRASGSEKETDTGSMELRLRSTTLHTGSQDC